MGKKQSVVVAVFDAVGGPPQSLPGGDGFQMGPTDPGKFTIASCQPHRSRRYPAWSSIPWGTPIKEQNGQILVQVERRWEPLSKYSRVTRQEILDYYADLYPAKAGSFPDRWVFNDFGHITCYYFEDRNHNRRRDRNEPLKGEMIHTTPEDEASTVQGSWINLAESHGCVHVKPTDIDTMRQKGYLRPGNSFIVHRYNEIAPTTSTGHGGGPFSVHFYPGSKKLVVFGVRNH
jgi:hypothetical protein